MNLINYTPQLELDSPQKHSAQSPACLDFITNRAYTNYSLRSATLTSSAEPPCATVFIGSWRPARYRLTRETKVAKERYRKARGYRPQYGALQTAYSATVYCINLSFTAQQIMLSKSVPRSCTDLSTRARVRHSDIRCDGHFGYSRGHPVPH